MYGFFLAVMYGCMDVWIRRTSAAANSVTARNTAINHRSSSAEKYVSFYNDFAGVPAPVRPNAIRSSPAGRKSISFYNDFDHRSTVVRLIGDRQLSASTA